jgi:hypothetical protein
MWKAILPTVKATFPVITGLFSAFIIINPLYSQQNIIADKDNTRPETTRKYSSPARITSFAATKFNGYNEIQWSALAEQNTRKFIVEYSFDGVNFQSAGQAISATGAYNLKHHILDTRPLLYRIRVEELSGKFYYSDNILLGGIEVLPVKIYPTIITGDVVNVNAYFPVERIAVVSTDGHQVMAKDLNGARDLIRVTLPALNKGLYWITFYGNGWKTTDKFIVS